MTGRRQLVPTLSFRTFAGVAALADHREGRIHLLNESAGELLEAVDSGRSDFDDDDEEFLDELARLGLLVAGEPQGRATSSTGTDEPYAEDDDEDGDIMDELNAMAERALVPLHCQLELTYRCPMACRHCYLDPNASRGREELSTEEIVAVLDELRDLGCLFLLLTGGEPFVRSDLLEIFDAARDRRFAVSLCTSGAVLDEALIAHMAGRGVDNIQVSLYGATAEVHDGLTRRRGSFDASLRFMRVCRDEGVRVRAAVTVVRENLHELEAMRDLIAWERFGSALGIYMMPRRDGDRSPTELMVDDEGLARVLDIFPPASSPRLRGKGPDDRPCGAGADAVSLDPFGTVHPCLSLRRNLGSVRERSLRGNLGEESRPRRNSRHANEGSRGLCVL